MPAQNNDTEVKPQHCPNCSGKGPFIVNSAQTVYRDYQKLTLQVGGYAPSPRTALLPPLLPPHPDSLASRPPPSPLSTLHLHPPAGEPRDCARRPPAQAEGGHPAERPHRLRTARGGDRRHG